MTTDRCPACGAAVSAGAPWCTLCYADLRPRQPEPVAVAAAPAPAAGPVAPAPAPAAPAVTLAPDPILDAPVAAPTPVARGELTTWPCASCGSQVPMADDVCSHCGASFLPTDPPIDLTLPVVGSVGRLDKGQRIGLMIGGVFLVMAVFMVIASVLGSIF